MIWYDLERNVPHKRLSLSFCLPLMLVLSAVLLAGCQGGGGADNAVADEHPTAPVRSFAFHYQATVNAVPESAQTAYLWIPVPPTTVDQTVTVEKIDTALPHEEVRDPRYGNRALRFALKPGSAAQTVALTFGVDRKERVRSPRFATPGDDDMPAADPALWLAGDHMVPIDGQIKTWADEVVAGKNGTAAKARAIYDYAVTNLKYDKTGTGWGHGDIYYACDARHGNCTDFHAVFTGFARAEGIPARFEIGFPVPDDQPSGKIGGYHCWAQFYGDQGGWVPIDASEACKHPEKAAYFFGSLDRNRVLFTVGRDITLPGMNGSPLNYFIYPYAEVDGKPWPQVEKEFSYQDRNEAPS